MTALMLQHFKIALLYALVGAVIGMSSLDGGQPTKMKRTLGLRRR